MFLGGSLAYDGFFSGQVFLNLFIDNAFLIVVAVGLTFVILGGGIDLSVGSMGGAGHHGAGCGRGAVEPSVLSRPW